MVVEAVGVCKHPMTGAMWRVGDVLYIFVSRLHFVVLRFMCTYTKIMCRNNAIM